MSKSRLNFNHNLHQVTLHFYQNVIASGKPKEGFKKFCSLVKQNVYRLDNNAERNPLLLYLAKTSLILIEAYGISRQTWDDIMCKIFQIVSNDTMYSKFIWTDQALLQLHGMFESKFSDSKTIEHTFTRRPQGYNYECLPPIEISKPRVDDSFHESVKEMAGIVLSDEEKASSENAFSSNYGSGVQNTAPFINEEGNVNFITEINTDPFLNQVFTANTSVYQHFTDFQNQVSCFDDVQPCEMKPNKKTLDIRAMLKSGKDIDEVCRLIPDDYLSNFICKGNDDNESDTECGDESSDESRKKNIAPSLNRIAESFNFKNFDGSSLSNEKETKIAANLSRLANNLNNSGIRQMETKSWLVWLRDFLSPGRREMFATLNNLY